MNFAAIVSGIFAIAKAVPVVASYIDKFVDMYVSKQIENIQTKIITMQHKRVFILKAIQGAKTDEERKTFSILLTDLTRK